VDYGYRTVTLCWTQLSVPVHQASKSLAGFVNAVFTRAQARPCGVLHATVAAAEQSVSAPKEVSFRRVGFNWSKTPHM
jgi:hypothetical protein